jgi:hypothetical protein
LQQIDISILYNMINLELGLNVVALTLKEDTPSGYGLNTYLFKFFSHATNDTLYFLGSVENSDKERYSQVNITVVNSIAQQELTQAIIYLPNTGFYEYTIYAQVSPDITPQPSDVLCEQGRVLYAFNEATITSFSPDIETIIYNG